VLDSFVVLEDTPDHARSAPETVSVSESVDPLFKHLGKNGVARVKEFKTYKDGWDSGKGRALNEKSEENLHSFLRSKATGFPTRPSVYLTPAGNLRLIWEKRGGECVELEFFPDGIEYFFESSGREGFAQQTAIDEILAAV